MFPSPVDVGAAFVEDFPILMANSGTTLAEGFLGLGLGIALAFVTAVLMDRYRFLYKSLYPILVITQTIPTVAIAPLLVLWMGYDMAPKIALVVIVCFFPMRSACSTDSGLRIRIPSICSGLWAPQRDRSSVW